MKLKNYAKLIVVPVYEDRQAATRLGWHWHDPAVGPTPGISCKGRGSPAGADLVSFIPLLDDAPRLSGRLLDASSCRRATQR